MHEVFNRKYKKVLEILPDVAECANRKLILVGGTALALFYLKHRISIDLDFIPVSGNDRKLKEELKGCLSKKGYRTTVGSFQNQFVVQFDDTGIKIEVFEPECVVKFEEHVFAGRKVLVAGFEDILQMKEIAYKNRQEARDLFDIFCMLRSKNRGLEVIKRLVAKFGLPKNIGDINEMAANRDDAQSFEKEVTDAS